jgi:thymidylate synthase
MKQYHDLINKILTDGKVVPDRTGTGTRKIFGHQMRFNLKDGFPLVTTKATHFKSVLVELLWMLRGETDLSFLHEHGVKIWDEWATADGELGPVYGAQWRSWQDGTGMVIDQINDLITNLVRAPFSRRHVVSAWNPSDLPDERQSPQENAEQGFQALPPCHALFQFDVSPDPAGGPNLLSCQLYQRSADVFLGVPFNIASYSLLTMLIAHKLGFGLGEFIWTGGDCHLYSNHAEQVKELMQRIPGELPTISFHHGATRPLEEIEVGDVQLHNYNHQGAIKAPVAI